MNKTLFAWAVIGAGPAGIAAVGKLIDYGIPPQKIAWIDPAFKVGDLGVRWHKVASNTKVKFFLKFFKECKIYQAPLLSKDFAIEKIDPEETCLLALVAEPLQHITNHLKSKVKTIQDKVQKLKLYNRRWQITLKDLKINANNVIMAIGAEPTSLAFPNIEEIPLYIALNPDQLRSISKKEDTIAVFGSSHSAIIVLKTLLGQCRVKKIINFYLSPLRYAVYFDDWILFDNTGLKGTIAEWARKYINGKLPAKLQRLISNEENIKNILGCCNKVIYATGFQKRHIAIEGMPTIECNEQSGIMAPGLFGLGIAFPEAKVDRYGILEYQVGLWKFMEYLNRILPLWLKYGT